MNVPVCPKCGRRLHVMFQGDGSGSWICSKKSDKHGSHTHAGGGCSYRRKIEKD